MSRTIKKLQVILSIVLLFSMFISVMPVYANTKRVLKITNGSAYQGNDATVEVKVELNELLEVANLSFTLEYDADNFNVSNIELEPNIKEQLALSYNIPSAGRIAVIGGGEDHNIENEEYKSPVLIATIKFSPKDSVVIGKKYPVTFNKANLTTIVNGEAVSADESNLEKVNGSITINKRPSGGGGGTSNPAPYLPGGGDTKPDDKQDPDTKDPDDKQDPDEKDPDDKDDPDKKDPDDKDPSDVDEKPTSVDSFADVDESFNWSRSAVDFLVKRGVIGGTSSTTFEPARSITRAEFTKIIVAAFNFEDTEGDVSFTDVSEDDWHHEFVLVAVKNGLVRGYPEGDFRPNATISREEMATILVRAFENLGIEVDAGEMNFTDADDIGDWASEYVAALANLGIVQGRGDNMFVPKDNLTRAEAAVVIYNSFTRFLE